jgi:hypothetical protein
MNVDPLDFTQPIETEHLITGQITPAKYLRHQTMRPDRFEISFDGDVWTVRADHIVQGRTNADGQIAPDYRVRNCKRRAA